MNRAVPSLRGARILACALALACCTPESTADSGRRATVAPASGAAGQAATGPAASATPSSPPAASAAAAPRPRFQSDGRPLSTFFQALQAVESGQSSQPVTIIQLGDSHTAGDVFTGRLRQRFQDRFGAAGRGMLPPGSPFPYFRPGLVEVSQTAGWQVANSFSAGGGLFGLSGFRVRATSPSDVLTLESQESAGFDMVALEVVRQPGGGTIVVSVDGRQVQELPTRGDIMQAARLDLPVPARSHRLELRPRGDGPVELLSWTVQRSGRGVVLDSHGIVGVTVNIIGNWEPATVAWELANRDPALIILAYGTNEAFHPDVTRDGYAAEFTARLRFIEQAAPGASILVIGPPDADRLPDGCRGGGRGRPARGLNDFSCAPLSAAESANYYAFLSRPSAETCRWHPPPALAMVREAQRSVTQARGHVFWDWSQVMGGACGTHNWAIANPPLAFEDHVHLKPAGYQASADALFDELMSRYAAFRAGTSTSGLPVTP